MQRGYVAIELNKLLQNSGFLEHLHEIQKRVEGLEPNEEHKEVAKKLCTALEKAKQKLLFIPAEGEVRSAKAKTAMFKYECKAALNDAMLVLKEDASWRQLLQNMMNAVVSVGNYFRRLFADNPFHMFAEPRESAKIVSDLYQDVLQITVGT